jgi:hypothetical protein
MKFFVLLLALGFAVLVFGCGEKSDDIASISKAIPGVIPKSVPFAEPPVTPEMADQVRLAMSQAEATRILGSPGASVPRETKNVPGITRYVWRNRDGSALILDFKDNKIGLKEWRKPKS